MLHPHLHVFTPRHAAIMPGFTCVAVPVYHPHRHTLEWVPPRGWVHQRAPCTVPYKPPVTSTVRCIILLHTRKHTLVPRKQSRGWSLTRTINTPTETAKNKLGRKGVRAGGWWQHTNSLKLCSENTGAPHGRLQSRTATASDGTPCRVV